MVGIQGNYSALHLRRGVLHNQTLSKFCHPEGALATEGSKLEQILHFVQNDNIAKTTGYAKFSFTLSGLSLSINQIMAVSL
jgi:hypothetical protein